MPEKMKRALEAEADKKGLTGERRDRYVYGTMVKAGWRPGMGEREGEAAVRRHHAAKKLMRRAK